MGWLRVAGTGQGPAGETVTWSLAEGSRGRRWREVVVRDGMVAHSLLLELDPDGRFAHLELSTPSGLLTLHPEGDGTLHGNAVTAAGIRHVAGLAWAAHDVVLVAGSRVCAAVAAAPRPEAAGLRTALHIAPDLGLSRRTVTDQDVGADDRGLPRLGEARTWPLELPLED